MPGVTGQSTPPPLAGYIEDPNNPGRWIIDTSAQEAGGGTIPQVAPITTQPTQAQPVPAFTYRAYEKLVLGFTNNTLNQASAFLWTFGDGTSSTQRHPIHQYAVAGTYVVILTAKNSAGQQASTSSIISVSYVSTAVDFTTVKSGLLVKFTDTSTKVGTRSWDFGEGTTSETTAPLHRYSTAGDYQVTLTIGGEEKINTVSVAEAAGGFSSVIWQDFVNTSYDVGNDALIKNAGASAFDADAISTQSITSAINGAGARFLLWANIINVVACGLSNGNPGQTLAAIDYAFVCTQTGDGELISIQENGVQVWTSVTFDEYLNARYSILVNALGEIEYYVEASDGMGGYLAAVLLYTSLVAPTFPLIVDTALYEQNAFAGIYIAEINEGGSVSPPELVAAFSVDVSTGDAPLTVTCTDLTTGTPTTWAWEDGQGGTSAAQNPSFVYDTPGVYTIRLTASTALGSSVYQVTVIVTDPNAPAIGDQVTPAGVMPGTTLQALIGQIGYYVVDTENSQIKIHSPAGALLKTFGGVGTEFGKFWRPTTCSVINGRQLLDRIEIIEEG